MIKEKHRNPLLTVDIIIETTGGIILIKRKNPPLGWAIPGGFVDYGETLEQAAVREAKEETCLDIKLIQQFHSYSDPSRDPRFHTVTTVFIARSGGKPKADDDAADLDVFQEREFPSPIVFDHSRILEDYFRFKNKESLSDIFPL